MITQDPTGVLTSHINRCKLWERCTSHIFKLLHWHTSQPSVSSISSLSSAAISVLGTAINTRELARGGCSAPTYEDYSAFAQSFCMTNRKGNRLLSRFSRELQRKIVGIREIVVAAVATGKQIIIKLLSELYDQDNLSRDNIKEFIDKDRLLHLQQNNSLGN